MTDDAKTLVELASLIERRQVNQPKAAAKMIREAVEELALWRAAKHSSPALELLKAESVRMREALVTAENYIEAVVINTPDRKKRRNYQEALSIVRAALKPEPSAIQAAREGKC